jgi:chromosome segregation protein
MYLKAINLKGFKSFPDRTRLTFSPGVSVIVGPNGCGKSNITDAVLWALGEQSPLAVRGQSMRDVIFAGGNGQSRRRFAEVEVVIDTGRPRGQQFSEIVSAGSSETATGEAPERRAAPSPTSSRPRRPMGREMHWRTL